MQYLDSNSSPRPEPASSGFLIAGVGAGYFLAGSASIPYEAANLAAWSMAVAVGASVWYDSLRGIRNLMRVDLLCIVAFFGLTLLEFLFPQPTFNDLVSMEQTQNALGVVFLGFVGLIIGRHLVKPSVSRLSYSLPDVPPNLLVGVCWGALFAGSLHQWLAVGFNPSEWLDATMGPRFKVPWARGRLGGWSALLNELALAFYCVPAIAGMALARGRDFSGGQKMSVYLCFAILTFMAFCAGTRNVFASYAAVFLASYMMSKPQVSFFQGIRIAALTGVVCFFCFYHMLEFRNMGLTRYLEYIQAVQRAEDVDLETRETLFIDFNLYNIVLMQDAFPSQFGFLGPEVIYVAATKPVPRALWRGKPEGLSVSIEEAAGENQATTLAVTFAGEGFIAFGMLGVLGFGLFFGALAAYWNRLAVMGGSALSLIVYAVGAYAAVLSMRSVMFFTTALLPVVALLVLAQWFKKNA